MSKFNGKRVVLGGLLAGLIINLGEFLLNEVLLKSQWEAAMSVLNLTPPPGAAILVFVVGGFVTGVLMLWLYAAVRPRCGAGPKTALTIGIIVWIIGCLIALMPPLMMGILPQGLVWTMIIWCLFEIVIAAVAGASIYREE